MSMLEKYISSYQDGILFESSRKISKELCGIAISITVMEHYNNGNHRQKAHIVLKKGALQYECDFIDVHNWEDSFYRITWNNRTYLCFRKTLYGFTFLDAETLTEAYDYFPIRVFSGDESFIITDANSFGNLILFDGCYWSQPYTYFAYDHAQKRFLNFSDVYGVLFDSELLMQKDTLILTGTNEQGKSVAFTIPYQDLCRHLNEQGTLDF